MDEGFLILQTCIEYDCIRINNTKVSKNTNYYFQNHHEKKHLIIIPHGYIFCDGKILNIWTFSDVVIKIRRIESEENIVKYASKPGFLRILFLLLIRWRLQIVIMTIVAFILFKAI